MQIGTPAWNPMTGLGGFAEMKTMPISIAMGGGMTLPLAPMFLATSSSTAVRGMAVRQAPPVPWTPRQ